MTVGTIVRTGVRPAPSDRDPAPGSTFFVVTEAERGDTTRPIEVTSMAAYDTLLGARTTFGYGYDALSVFFGDGGGRALVSRVVGPTPTTGTASLNDRAGSPLPTIAIDAASAGAWSTQLTYTVANGLTANTFVVTVFLNGNQVDRSPDLATPAAAVQWASANPWIRIRNLSSVTAAPTNNPAVVSSPTALSAGSDDRANIADTHRVAALARFTPDLGAGVVAIPGATGSTIWNGLIAHGSITNRDALLASAAGASKATQLSNAAGLRNTTGNEYAGLFGPWLQIADGAGGTRTIPPEGYVAAARARTLRDPEGGPWRWPAGQIARSKVVQGVETAFTKQDIDDLTTGAVNPIWMVAGAPELFGWYSLSGDQTNYASLAARDTLNVLAQAIEEALRPFNFEPLNDNLYADIHNAVRGIVEPMRAAGGLKPIKDDDGTELDPGYLIDVSEALNPPSVQQANQVNVAVSVRPVGAAALINVTLTKVAVTSPF